MSAQLKVGICLPEVSGAVCGLALPGQAVFGAVLALLLQLWEGCSFTDLRACSQPSFTLLGGFWGPFLSGGAEQLTGFMHLLKCC